MSEPTWQDWLRSELFEHAPISIAVIDPEFRVVTSNRNFEGLFGEARGRPCYEVEKHRTARCEQCMAGKTFRDGRVRVNEETGLDRNGRTVTYLVHVAPVLAEDGSIPFVVEMSTDVTEAKRLKLEYQTLFEQVPCYVAVLNRDLRVVRANSRFREKFGEPSGRPCYEMLGGRSRPCEGCPARATFEDGEVHASEQQGVGRDGRPTNFVVTTAPASRRSAGFSHVIEMATDVTAERVAKSRLRGADALREALAEHAPCGIVGFTPGGEVSLVNPAAEELTGLEAAGLVGKALPAGLLPREIEEVVSGGISEAIVDETSIRGPGGEEVPVRLSAHAVKAGEEELGTAVFLQDLRSTKRLEREKVEAERLSAVGQTVAGLAHGIRNVMTGLEGGMYFLESGLSGGRKERLDEGWEMLKRNVEKISTLVRNLLAFSRGRTPGVVVVDPRPLVREVVDLYRPSAWKEGVLLTGEAARGVRPAALDAEAIRSALANLVTNAIDACLSSGRPGCRVCVRARDEGENLVFEVEDEGIGMDREVRDLAFTNFFTTKGAGGTGLGLLLTRKITQEHGGRISIETSPGLGSVFRLVFPRERLPKPSEPGGTPG